MYTFEQVNHRRWKILDKDGNVVEDGVKSLAHCEVWAAKRAFSLEEDTDFDDPVEWTTAIKLEKEAEAEAEEETTESWEKSLPF